MDSFAIKGLETGIAEGGAVRLRSQEQLVLKCRNLRYGRAESSVSPTEQTAHLYWGA